jgi:hypothetical protein
MHVSDEAIVVANNHICVYEVLALGPDCVAVGCGSMHSHPLTDCGDGRCCRSGRWASTSPPCTAR